MNNQVPFEALYMVRVNVGLHISLLKTFVIMIIIIAIVSVPDFELMLP